nr:SpoIIE family protein phosphatase [Desulfonema ishimotonii]
MLGAMTLISFLSAWLIHKPLERRLVRSAGATVQPRRQFLLDYALVLMAGMVVTLLNYGLYQIPIDHGVRFFIGYVASGFFISLDMALARERQLIQQALREETVLPPPERLYSMTRRFFGVALGTVLLVVTVISLVISRDLSWLSTIGRDAISISVAMEAVVYELVFIMVVLLIMVINLIWSYAGNLRLLFETETGILENVTRGDLSRLVPVATHDEFGAIAGYTNNMIQGLRHRFQLISALNMAEEVQQNLLPQNPPEIPGLELAGTSLYCDRVGGDYYDYVELTGHRLGVVVTDASGHGVGSALHMTTARAFLRFGIRDYTGPARLISEVNRMLTRDSYETGRFTTLFFLEIHPAEKSLRWVRAGHDPALLYDPAADTFETLSGEGMALGVMADFEFREYERRGWPPDAVVFIGTDGIHETRNAAGEMFGNERLRAVIREHGAEPAEAVRDAIIVATEAFRGDTPQEDDLTLVVVRLG